MGRLVGVLVGKGVGWLVAVLIGETAATSTVLSTSSPPLSAGVAGAALGVEAGKTATGVGSSRAQAVNKVPRTSQIQTSRIPILASVTNPTHSYQNCYPIFILSPFPVCGPTSNAVSSIVWKKLEKK